MRKKEKIEIAYILPVVTITGGVGIVMRHVYELGQRGRTAAIFSADMTGNGDWYHLRDKIAVYDIAEYHDRCGADGAEHLVATWWETAFIVSRLPAEHKHYFLQSLENRFYPAHSISADLFFLTFFLGLSIFTEARWIAEWIGSSFGTACTVAPNGIDTDLFYPVPNPASAAPRLRVLIEGPLQIPYKGIDDCFLTVKDLDVEVWLVTNSDKPVNPDWNIDRLFRYVPIEQMKDIYSQCDVLLKLSSVEGVFGPPLEMMACGGTCIVSDVTGHDEYCVHEKNCLIVPMHSVPRAREALERLLADHDLLERLKNEARKTPERFSWKSTGDILDKQIFAANRPRHDADRNIPRLRDPRFGVDIPKSFSALFRLVKNEMVIAKLYLDSGYGFSDDKVLLAHLACGDQNFTLTFALPKVETIRSIKFVPFESHWGGIKLSGLEYVTRNGMTNTIAYSKGASNGILDNHGFTVFTTSFGYFIFPISDEIRSVVITGEHKLFSLSQRDEQLSQRDEQLSQRDEQLAQIHSFLFWKLLTKTRLIYVEKGLFFIRKYGFRSFIHKVKAFLNNKLKR